MLPTPLESIVLQARLAGGLQAWRWLADARWLRTVQRTALDAQLALPNEEDEVERQDWMSARSRLEDLLQTAPSPAASPEAVLLVTAWSESAAAIIEACQSYFALQAEAAIAFAERWLPAQSDYVAALGDRDRHRWRQCLQNANVASQQAFEQAVSNRCNLVLECSVTELPRFEAAVAALARADYHMQLAIVQLDVDAYWRELCQSRQARRDAVGLDGPPIGRRRLRKRIRLLQATIPALLRRSELASTIILDHDGQLVDMPLASAPVKAAANEPPRAIVPGAFRLGDFSKLSSKNTAVAPATTAAVSSSDAPAQASLDCERRRSLQAKLRQRQLRADDRRDD